MKKIIVLLAALFATPSWAGVSCSLPFQLQNNTTADATQVMANYNALVTCLQSAAAAGVNSDITALTALSVPLTAAQGGSTLYIGGTSTGTANAQVVGSVAPSGLTLTSGYRVLFLGGFTNTGPTTLNVAGTGAKSVQIQTPSGDVALVGGEILSGQWNEVIYHAADSTWHLFGVSSQLGGVGPVTSLVSQSTVDLAQAGNHNASITGTTTITSFGSNATVAFPLYRITFTGSLTLTYNASSMILPGAVNIQTAANDSAFALYLGGGNWQVIDYQRANGTAVVSPTPNCGFNRLAIANNSGTPNTNIDVTAASGVVLNGTVPFYASSISFTINTTTGNVTSTANGMDGESRPTSGWVYLYMISNGSAMAGLGSTSASAPTLPSGYAYSCYMGAMRTDGSANFLRSVQRGADTDYNVVVGSNTAAYPTLASGVQGTNCALVGGFASASITGLVPSTSTKIRVIALANGSTSTVVAPTNTVTGLGANASPIGFSNAAGNITIATVEFVLISTSSVFVCSNNASNQAQVLGWRDSVSAN